MGKEASMIADMKKLGLSECEVKAYLSLLRDYPLNGYALSKRSGIPRSRIYEVLKSLKAKQIVFEQQDGKGAVYEPLDPKLLVSRLKNDYDNLLGDVSRYTEKLYREKDEDHKVVVIDGRKQILEFLNLLISDAENRIVLSIWEEELAEIQDSLDKALERGVRLRGIFFGRENRYGDLVPHRRIERYLSEKKARFLTVIVDGKNVVSGVVSKEDVGKVTWTKDSGFINMSEDYVVHDIMVNRYAASLDPEALARFEAFGDSVRKDYFCFTDEEFDRFER